MNAEDDKPVSTSAAQKGRTRQPGRVLRLPPGTTHLVFEDLAHLIADATWPADGRPEDERSDYIRAHVNLEEELVEAVDSGALRILDPFTLGPHRFPMGAALRRAKVAVEDLQDWLLATRRRMQISTGSAETPQAAPTIKPVQRRMAQEEAIVAKLMELGYTPEALPIPAPGKRCPAKQAIREAFLGVYSKDVVKKAWQRLRDEGRIKDA